ncbi:fimbrillin family protein, partial [Bacteroides heparinolyticus]
MTRLIRTTLLCSIVFCNTACVNSIGEDAETELEEGTIPISFSVKIKKATTKVTGNLFEKGDQMGLIATTSSSSIKGKRYINNLPLEYTEGSTLVPKKTVFYPEGDVPLNFISYYPYQAEGVPEGTSTLPVSVQTDQSNEKNRSQSDFLVATAKNITGKNKTVALEFQHKLAKLTITLIPDTDNTAGNLLKANPRIIATGFKTSADYNLEDGTFANLEGTKDIIASGEWIVKDNKLVGKEIIIIPQAIEDGKHFF